MNSWLRKNADLLGAYSSIAGLVLAPLIVIGGVAGYLQLKDALNTPDVILLFGNPQEPRIWLPQSVFQAGAGSALPVDYFQLRRCN